jgi:hypothetical protein
MFVQFITDGNGTGNGFQASYTTKPAPFCQPNTLNTITSVSGKISDGSGSYNYRNNTVCKYKLVPNGANSISITFNYFDTEAKSDFLKIYDLETQSLLYTFSGNTNPGTLNFNTGKLYIVFMSNNDSVASGWDFSYTSSLITDLTDRNLNMQASVFPNPAQKQLQVNIGDVGKGCILSLVSSDGKVVYQENPASTGQMISKIDVSGFKRGLYILKIKSEKGCAHFKVVLN